MKLSVCVILKDSISIWLGSESSMDKKLWKETARFVVSTAVFTMRHLLGCFNLNLMKWAATFTLRATVKKTHGCFDI